MDKTDYALLYQNLSKELSDLHGRRTQLEIELADIKNQMTTLEKTLESVAVLAGYADPFGSDLAGLGITDAVREVLDPKERLSVKDIKTKMEQRGYDFSSYSAPAASISTVLGRLIKAGDATSEKEGWNVFYKGVKENIPF